MATARFKHLRHPPRLPLVLRWEGPENPLPVRMIRCPRTVKVLPPYLSAPAWQATGVPNKPFDFCLHLTKLCTDIISRCEELAHIDSKRLLFAVTQARNGFTHGLQARVTPLRFPGGKLTLWRRGVVYQVQRFLHGDLEFLYLVTFCLPRFLNQDFDNKLITLFHELYHISPTFDGDLRRHKGRYSLHTHSQREYDDHMADLARRYMAQKPDPKLIDFLRLNFSQLQHRHGSVTGIMVPRPKIIPIAARR